LRRTHGDPADHVVIIGAGIELLPISGLVMYFQRWSRRSKTGRATLLWK
jgi:hypothetical protein